MSPTAFDESFFERIVDVHWGTPSTPQDAVVFNGGGHLSLSGLDLSTSIISFWFRVPSSTANAALADFNARAGSSDPNADMAFAGTIPLLAWGPTDFNTYSFFGGTGHIKTSSSFIGVQTGQTAFESDEPTLNPHIAIRLQSKNNSSVIFRTNEGPFIVAAGGNYYAMGDQTVTIGGGGSNIVPYIEGWNHILVSLDIQGPHGTLWVVLNGVNYSGSAFDPSSAATKGVGGDNDIIAVYNYPNIGGGNTTVKSGGFAMPTSPFGVPFPSAYRQYGQEPVAMAELQIFTGITCDSSAVGAFLSSDGFPLEPTVASTYFGTLVAPLLQTVLLSGSANWIKGNNTGTAGGLQPTKSITRFLPNPHIGS